MFHFSLRAMLLDIALLAVVLTGFFNPSVAWAAIATTATVAILIGSTVFYLTSGECRSSRKALGAFVIAGWIYFTMVFGFYSYEIKNFLVTTIGLKALFAKTTTSAMQDPFAGILAPPHAHNEAHHCFMLYGQACSTIIVAMLAAAVTSVVNSATRKRRCLDVAASCPPDSNGIAG